MEPLNWTTAQKREAQNYKSGQVLVFHKNTKDAQRHQSFEVVDYFDGSIITQDAHGQIAAFTGKQAKAFSVFKKQDIEVAAGDKLLLQQNRRGDLHATNGERATVSRVDPEGFIHLEHGRILPKDYRQFDTAYHITA